MGRRQPDLLDRRARLAATNLLMAFDLPAPADQASRQMITAAKCCPGVTMDEIAPLGRNQRLACLHKARLLIEEMLAELPAETDPWLQTR